MLGHNLRRSPDPLSIGQEELPFLVPLQLEDGNFFGQLPLQVMNLCS